MSRIIKSARNANKVVLAMQEAALLAKIDALTALNAELVEALGKWKCNRCYGRGDYENHDCEVCAGEGIHPTAFAAIAKAKGLAQ